MKNCTSSFLLIAALLTVTAGMAQVKRTPKAPKQTTVYDTASIATPAGMDNAEKGKAGKLKALNLTKEQKQQIKALKEDNKAKKEAIANDSTLNEAQRKEKMKALKRQNASKIQTVLTPEQQQKLKAMRKEKKQGSEAKPDGQ